jgi:hypothetical protein
MRKRKLWKGLALLAVAIVITRKLEERDAKLSGRILGVPYDFYPLTLAKIRKRFWNPDDPRIFTPHVFGVGWSVNFYALMGRMASRCPYCRAMIDAE